MDKIPLNRILDLLNGRTLSDSEKSNMDAWMADEEHARQFESIKLFWAELRNSEDFDIRKARRILRRRIRAERPAGTRFLWIPAAAAALIGAALLIPRYTSGPSVSGEAVSETFEIVSNNGCQTRSELPDGTFVVLNSGSSLSYASDFNRKSRYVTLSGEGYFEVASNPDKPFVVSAAGCKFTVLGTKFNISAYDTDDAAVAALVQGSLLVSGDKESVMMKPGEITSINLETSSMTKTEGDVRRYTSWLQGFHRYDNIRLTELVSRLSREYNADIQLTDGGMDELSVRISFKLTDPLEDILASLSEITPIEVSKADGKYIIKQSTNTNLKY